MVVMMAVKRDRQSKDSNLRVHRYPGVLRGLCVSFFVCFLFVLLLLLLLLLLLGDVLMLVVTKGEKLVCQGVSKTRMIIVLSFNMFSVHPHFTRWGGGGGRGGGEGGNSSLICFISNRIWNHSNSAGEGAGWGCRTKPTTTSAAEANSD